MSNVPRWDRLIATFGLAPHPKEGGYYKETYRSDECTSQEHLPSRYGDTRSFQTAILFLLVENQVSKLHRLKSDEVWHFLEGSTLTLHEFTADGNYRTRRFGSDVFNGELIQLVVPRGSWFGACVNDPTSYALFGCTVSPGFDFRDLEIGDRNELVKLFPEQKQVIELLT